MLIQFKLVYRPFWQSNIYAQYTWFLPQTSQEGNEGTTTKEKLRTYCPDIYIESWWLYICSFERWFIYFCIFRIAAIFEQNNRSCILAQNRGFCGTILFSQTKNLLVLYFTAYDLNLYYILQYFLKKKIFCEITEIVSFRFSHIYNYLAYAFFEISALK